MKNKQKRKYMDKLIITNKIKKSIIFCIKNENW